MGLSRWKCCQKLVCHCSDRNDNAAQREIVINARTGKELDPSKLHPWGGKRRRS